MFEATIGCSAFSTAVRSLRLMSWSRRRTRRAPWCAVDRVAAEILDAVVVRVYAVKRRPVG